MDTPRRVFGIKAKHSSAPAGAVVGYSAPSFWNQGKAAFLVAPAEVEILRAEFLESRQSHPVTKNLADLDTPRRVFGIKAKPHPDAAQMSPRYSAPSFWNQGKAPSRSSRSRPRILRAEFLESRQSQSSRFPLFVSDTPRRVFGIKAKPTTSRRLPAPGYSAPSFWNQGKAELDTSTGLTSDTPRRVFGIKAKPEGAHPQRSRGYSAPSFWNQGKAPSRRSSNEPEILRAEFLESRQSILGDSVSPTPDTPRRVFGIKAKRLADRQ